MEKIICFRNTLKKLNKFLLKKCFVSGFICIFILCFSLYQYFRGFEVFFLLIYILCLILLSIVFINIFIILLLELIIISKYGKKVKAKIVNIKYRFSSKGLSQYTLFLEFEYGANTLLKSLNKSSLCLSNSTFISKYFNKIYFIYYTDKLPDRVFEVSLIKNIFIIFLAFIIAIFPVLVFIYEIVLILYKY